MTGEAVTDAYAYGEAVCGQVGRRFGRTTSSCGLLKPQDLFGLRSGCAPRGRDMHRLAKVVRSPFSYRSSAASPSTATSSRPARRQTHGLRRPSDTICSWTLTFRRRSESSHHGRWRSRASALEIQLHVRPVSRQGAGGVCSQVFADTPQHTYQVLTKRSTRLRRLAGERDWPANL